MPKKSEIKKKKFQQFCKLNAQDGRINNAAGMWIARSQAPNDSMRDNYSPQSGKAK